MSITLSFPATHSVSRSCIGQAQLPPAPSKYTLPAERLTISSPRPDCADSTPSTQPLVSDTPIAVTTHSTSKRHSSSHNGELTTTEIPAAHSRSETAKNSATSPCNNDTSTGTVSTEQHENSTTTALTPSRVPLAIFDDGQTLTPRISTAPSTSSSPEAARKPEPGEKEKEAEEKERQQHDQLAADAIYARMKVERELHKAKIQALLQDMQTEIRRIFQEVILRRQKIHDDLFKAWSKVFIG